ncbi:O-antigen ligase family protein [Ornithinicoccus halotolerans]|uniref:O-antigen ligase family protein n=1 Tax=Ornithinicoccus halotolerans TaxID=1748220 RepID=UPI001885EA08|nr:O-antigen ligase family protein [Ornithinicoccus halotolerans]
MVTTGVSGSRQSLGDSDGPPAAHPVHVELYGLAALLGLAILIGEGNVAGPMVASFLAVLTASGALVVWLVRPGPSPVPVGLAWLLAMLTIGSMAAVVATAHGRAGDRTDLVRDVAIVLSYLGFIAAGHSFTRERRALRALWWLLLILGGVRSVHHLWLFTGQVSAGVSDLYLLRLEAGRGEQVQLVAVVATYLLVRGRPRRGWWQRLAIGAAVLCALSMTLAMSRILLLQLLIVAMVFAATRVAAGTGTLRLVLVRAVTVVGGGLALLTIVFFSLRFVSEPAYTVAYEGFVEKLFNSWNEVASTSQQSAQDIDQNYRAFESERGVRLFSDAGWFEQWFGLGWGTAVPLGLDTASTRSEFVRTEAAFLHNGYINYLVKTGMIGLACYVGFMLRLLYLAVFQSSAAVEDRQDTARRQALLALVLCLAAATVATGGLGFPAGFLSLALLLGTCLYTPFDRPRRGGDRRGLRLGQEVPCRSIGGASSGVESSSER